MIHWLLRPIHRLEVSPTSQFRFHGIFTVLWFVSMLVAPFIVDFRNQFATLVIIEISLWANFATHFGAMSAALSGVISEKTNELAQKEVVVTTPSVLSF